MMMETLEELEWCLEQLETIQTHKSVSDMATSKVQQSFLLLPDIVQHELGLTSKRDIKSVQY